MRENSGEQFHTTEGGTEVTDGNFQVVRSRYAARYIGSRYDLVVSVGFGLLFVNRG